jgi:hypothetical protein
MTKRMQNAEGRMQKAEAGSQRPDVKSVLQCLVRQIVILRASYSGPDGRITDTDVIEDIGCLREARRIVLELEKKGGRTSP